MSLNYYRLFLGSRDLISAYNKPPPSGYEGWGKYLDESLTNQLIMHRKRELVDQAEAPIMHRLEMAFLKETSLAKKLLCSITGLADHFLEERHGFIYVKGNTFSEWQNILSWLSPIPLLAQTALTARKNWEAPYASALTLLRHTLRYSSLPSICDPRLDHLMTKKASPDEKDSGELLDLHIHLSGTTEASDIWLKTMRDHETVAGAACKEFSKFERFYSEHGFTDDNDIRKHFWKSCCLRRWLALELTKASVVRKPVHEKSEILYNFIYHGSIGHDPDGPWASISANDPHPLQSIFIGRSFDCPSDIFPIDMKSSGADCDEILNVNMRQMEGELYLLLLYTLNKMGDEKEFKNDDFLAVMAHIYLLRTNITIQMLVQSVIQTGFDQFDRISKFAIRDKAEQEGYKDRIEQLHGMYGPDLHYIEARFAPKEEIQKLNDKISKIILGYKECCKQDEWRLPDIALIPHFIKEKDNQDGTGGCRHFSLRNSLGKKAYVLKSYLEAPANTYENRKYIVGKDAANNEMQTPPEVFAPAFRLLHRSGLTKTTFHVGEDYHHLVSGIRAVDEALEFLDLGPGDRIGHGVALGIDPKLWQNSVQSLDGEVTMYQGYWMDDLVWMHQLLIENRNFSSHCHAWEKTIHELFDAIYLPHLTNKKDYPQDFFPGIHNLWRAWSFRKWDARLFDETRIIGNFSIDEINEPKEHKTSEKNIINNLKNKYKIAFEVLKTYHSSSLRNGINEQGERELCEYEKPVSVPLDKTPPKLIRALQDIIINKINERGVIVEVMPTSNIRISCYKTYDDHHILRWLDEGDNKRPVPETIIASDDPGIFATNLRNEYAHLLQALKRKNTGGFQNPYRDLKNLRTRSLAYRFHRNASVLFAKNGEDTTPRVGGHGVDRLDEHNQGSLPHPEGQRRQTD